MERPPSDTQHHSNVDILNRGTGRSPCWSIMPVTSSTWPALPIMHPCSPSLTSLPTHMRLMLPFQEMPPFTHPPF